jgi:Flp pilus assembly protein TadG
MQLTSNDRRTTTDSPTHQPSRSARWSWRSGSDARRRLRSERGAAIIETAITLPLLLALCVGIFEFGRAYQTYQILTNAAREGARIAVLPNPVPGAAEARVREYLQMGTLTYDSTVGVAVTPVNTSMGAGATAPGSQVTVTYPFSFIMLQPVAQLLVNGSLVGSPITVTATSIMRNETGS